MENETENIRQGIAGEGQGAKEFVTKEDLTAFKTEIKAQTEIIGMETSTVVLVVAGIELLLLILVVICLIRMSAVKSNYQKILEQLNSVKDRNATLSDKVTRLEQRLAQQAERLEAAERAVREVKRPPEPARQVAPTFSASTFSAPPPPPPPPNPEDDYKELVTEFNALAGKVGFALNEAKKEFVSKYKVCAFSCTNYEARMNEPIPPPIFKTMPDVQTADLWAYEFKPGVYAVVPNVKIYTGNVHSARALKEIFQSNFAGGTYNTIILEKPAIFDCAGNSWQLKTAGVLQLR